jgi:hypothetical protein
MTFIENAARSELKPTVHHPETTIAEVLAWTNGQPFLTQKVCYLIAEHANENTSNVSELVQTYIIDQWQTQDEPEHLRTIRDRLLNSEQPTVQLLELYRQILKNGGAIADDSAAQVALRLSGLVVQQGKRIQVHNRIYAAVFNQDWVEQELKPLRPYAALQMPNSLSSRLIALQRFMGAEYWVFWAIWLGTAIAAGFASSILLDPILDSL